MAEEDVPVMEGFLCPICKSDLGTAGRLVTHFQDVHSDDQSEDLLKPFKDLLGKAKKKILKNEHVTETPKSHALTLQAKFKWEKQEIGVTVSHKTFFERARSARIEMYTSNKNRLLIRLDKLLDNIPTDPIKKKAHEQTVVPWLDGKAVKRCPDCTTSFHTAPKFVRQHHCRLCGSLMCHDCSAFLPVSDARKILDKAEDEHCESGQTLRLCFHCLNVLEARHQLKSVSKLIICQFYDRLMEYKAEADKSAALYNKMFTSLCAGETEYNLSNAQSLRMNILKQAEAIDALSQRIAVLGTKDKETPPLGESLRLQKSIRSAMVTYVRSQLLTLPALPSENDLKIAQFKRRQEMTAKIQEEKMQEAAPKLKSPVKPEAAFVGSPQRKSANAESHQGVSVGQGWVPRKKQFFDVDDPLILQINIIKNYIQEAKSAHKYDEVASLESNLQELNEEYWRQQQELEKMQEEELLTDSTQDESTEKEESSHSNDTQSDKQLFSLVSSS